MRKFLIILCVSCIAGLFEVRAQEYSPFISSPYAGVTAGKLNPASLAGSKYKFDVTLFGASGGVHNDLLIFGRKKIIFKPKFYTDLWDYQSQLLDLNLKPEQRTKIKDYLSNSKADWSEDGKKDGYGLYFGGQYDILNLMYSFNDRLAVAAGYGRRWQASANGIPEAMIGYVISQRIPGIGNSGGADRIVDHSGETTGAVAIYHQIFASAAYTFFQQNSHVLKGGLTGKLIFGGKSAFAYAKDYRGQIPGNISGRNGNPIGEAGVSKKGTGFGVDVGLEYEYRPAELAGDEAAEYRLKAGISVVDLGWFKTKDARHESLNGGRGIPTGINSLIDRYGANDNLGDYKMFLPTVLAASVDYRIPVSAIPLFVNFTPYIAFGQNSAHKAYKFNSYNLIPHVEWKNLGVSIPLQIDGYNRFTAGIGVRAFRHVWIGSNTLLKNLWIIGDKATRNKNFSADLHVMLKFPISSATGDRDKDGIADTKDKCPDVPGLKKYQGCPDSDGDGIPDDQDNCPNDAGLASTNGCPDKDGDGVPDKDDRCPEIAGTKDLRGCPDKDGDGIPDIDDECPEETGSKATKGCPDKDGDGVPDKDDRCPDQAGNIALKGCPDKDGDGVPDLEDECPDQSGSSSNKGCPVAQDIKNVEFDIDKYNIKAQFQPELDKAVDILSKNPNATVTVAGHTDNTYTRAYNIQLSKRRAEAVKNYFVQKNIDAQRISIEYYGFDKPIADNNTVEGRSRNRRSEVTIVIK